MGYVAYYIADKHVVTAQTLAEILPHTDGAQCESISHNQGVPGLLPAGCLVVTGRHGKMPTGYNRNAKDYKWLKCGDGVWVSIVDVTPEDLVRSSVVNNSRRARLGDNNYWLIPVASQLPRKMFIDADGGWATTIHDRYASLWERCKPIFDIVANNDTDTQIRDCDVWELIADFVSLNYRVSKYELSLMGVFCSESMKPAVFTVLDLVDITEESIEKKTTSD